MSLITVAKATIQPIISPITITPNSGKAANDIGGIIYTNDQKPTISAAFDSNEGAAIDSGTAILRVNGVPNPSITLRSADGIGYTSSSGLVSAGYNISVNVKNIDGVAASRVAKTIVVDITAPAVPVIASPVTGTYSNPGPVISGEAEANTDVRIYDGDVRIAQTVADSDGNFSVALDTLSVGIHILTSRAVDYAGNVSDISGSVTYTLKALPAVPTLNHLSAQYTLRPTFSWNSVDGISDYRIQIGNNNFSSVFADQVVPINSFVPGADLPSGSIYWRVASHDSDGLESDFSAPDNFTIDTTPPQFVAGSTLPADGSVTDNDRVAVSGAFTSGNGNDLDRTSLRLSINGVDVTTGIAWLDNVFTFTPIVSWNDDSYVVEVDLADNAGNRSSLIAWTFTVSSAPTVTEAHATGGRAVPEYINSTNTGFKVSGNVRADDHDIQTVRLYSDDTPFASTIVLPTLATYSITLTDEEFSQLKSTEGKRTLTLDRTGFSGNTSVKSLPKDITIDLAPPLAPSGNVALNQNAPGKDDEIVGLPGAAAPTSIGVYVYDAANPDHPIGSAEFHGDGGFGPISIGDNLYGEVLVAYRDLAGNESDKIGGYFNRIIAPSAPIIKSPSGTVYSSEPAPQINGSIVDEGNIALIYVNDTLSSSGFVDDAGNFSITLPGLSTDGTYLIMAKVQDSAGNTSDASLSVNFVLDSISPQAVFVAPTGVTDQSSGQITVGWSDDGSGFADDPERALSFGGGISVESGWDASSKKMTYTPEGGLDDGNYQVSATVYDRAGNAGSVSFSFTINTIKVEAGENKISNASFVQDATVSALYGIKSYLWSKVSGPGEINFGSPDQEDTTISASADGNYVIRLTVVDLAGNISSDEMNLIWDTTPPVVNAGQDRATNGSITQGGSASDSLSGIATYHWSAGSDAVVFDNADNISTTITISGPGTYNIRLSVIDRAGNSSYDEMVLVWDDLAPLPPDISVNDSINKSNTNNFIISGGGEAGSALFLVVSDGNPTHDISATGSVDLNGLIHPISIDASGLDDGTVAIVANLVDEAGNTSENTIRILTKDIISPLLSLVQISSNNTANNLAKAGDTVTLDIASNEEIDSPVVKIDGQSAAVSAVDASHYIATRQMAGSDVEGVVSFTIDYLDLAGNTGSIVSQTTDGSTVIFDKSSPVLTINNLVTNDTSPAISGSVDDNKAIVDVAVNGQTYRAENSNGSWIVADNTLPSLNEGNYAVDVKATDSAGNTGNAAGTLFIDLTAPSTEAGITPAAPDGTNGWYKSVPAISLNASDNSSGTNKTYYHFGNSNDALYTSPVSAPSGSSTLYYHSVDSAGNIENQKSLTTKVDTSASSLPSNSVLEDMDSDGKDDDLTSNRQIRIVWPSGADSISGVSHYLLRARKNSTSGTEIISNYDVGSVTSYTLSTTQAGLLEEAKYYFGIAVVDNAGNISSYRNSDGITLDLTSPHDVSIKVNNDEIYTKSQSVALTLAGSDSSTPLSMNLSNNSDLSADGLNVDSGKWLDFASSKSWQLASGDGEKRVYSAFRDGAGNVSPILSDSIILDTAAPSTPTIDPIGGYQGNSVVLSGGAEPKSTVNISLAGSSTINVFAIANDQGRWNLAVDISALNDGLVNVKATVTDLAGNVSSDVQASFTKNTVHPVFNNIVVSPTIAVLGTTATISFAASEELSASPTVKVGNNTANLISNSGLNYVYSYTVTAADPEGIQVVTISGSNLIGNSGTSTSSLVIDFTGPTIGSGSPGGVINNATPTIKALILDSGGSGVNAQSIVMRINGVAVTSSFDEATGIVQFKPARPLPARHYSVTIDAKDKAGNSATRYSFSFTIAP